MLVLVNIVPIDVDGSEQRRATGVMIDSSLGSDKGAGDELPVPSAAMAAGDPAYAIPNQASRTLLSVMPTFLLLSVSAFSFSSTSCCSRYIPSLLPCISFSLLGSRHASHI